MKLFSIVRFNLIALLIYSSAGIFSIIINGTQSYFTPLWLPLAVSIGYVYFKGIYILPGLALGSLIAHYPFGLHFYPELIKSNFQLFIPLLFVSSEMVTLILFNHFKNKWNWEMAIENRLLKIKVISFFSLILPLPIVGIQLLYLYYLNNALPSITTLSILILTNSLAIIIFTPLYISWSKDSFSKLFLSNKELLTFISSTVIMGVVIGLSLFNQFLEKNSILLILLLFSYFTYLSINYSIKVFTITLGIFSLFFFWKILPSINDIHSHYTIVELLAALMVLVISSLYIKGKFYSRHKTIYSLKSDYNFIEEEVNRQLIEYRDLNNKLFTEIEKRGIAERELEQSRKLLSEAQEVSGIGTWEYSIAKKRFKWISNNPLASILDFNIENESLKSFASRVHPNDLNSIVQLNKSTLNESRNFEVEVRIINRNKEYGYFLIKGQSVLEKGKVTRILGLIMDITRRKLAEQILLEKEERYKALFDSNIDPVCVIDAKNYEIKDVNPALETIYGYSRAELIGQSYLNLSAQPEETKTAIAFSNQKGHYRVSQRVHKRKNGEEFFIEANLMKHLVDGREMFFIIIHDITRRKEAESKIAERELKFRLFFESDLIGMAEMSIAKELISFNKKLSSILGYSANDLKKLTWDDLTFKDDQLSEIRLFNQVLTHEIDGYTIEKQCISKKGTIVHCKVSLKAIKTGNGNISHFILLIDDVSDRKKAETELKESRAKLRQSQAVAKLGTIRFFPGNDTVSLSEEAYEILGFGNRKPILTRHDFFKSILPSSNTRFEEQICDLENGIKVEGDYEQAFVTPKGEVKYILTNFGVSSNSDLQVIEVLATMADITRIKRAEMALHEANTLKDQLFSIIGHDLRSPMGAINQLISSYRQKVNILSKEESDSILETLCTTSEETYKLLESLLEWSKSQKTDDFKPVKTNLALLVNQAITLNTVSAEAKNITIQKDLIDQPIVLVDVDMMNTVLRNLISNSIKFTPNSGHVSIEISENNGSYTVSVKDTGVGITPSEMAKLFDNSFSYTTLGTNNEKGTGLGLKLVKKFVEKNAGEIFIESIPNQGSNFSFTLPCYAE